MLPKPSQLILKMLASIDFAIFACAQQDRLEVELSRISSSRSRTKQREVGCKRFPALYTIGQTWQNNNWITSISSDFFGLHLYPFDSPILNLHQHQKTAKSCRTFSASFSLQNSIQYVIPSAQVRRWVERIRKDPFWT